MAITRVWVRDYLGTVEPPAPGSTWATAEHKAEIAEELARLGGAPDQYCDAYRFLRGCRGGSCSPRSGGAE